MSEKARQPVPKKGLAWRKDLGVVGRLKVNSAWPEVEKRLLAGESVTVIARWLRQRGLGVEVTEKTLCTKLRAHRDKAGAVEVLPIERLPKYVQRAAAAVGKGEPLLRELDWLIMRQRARVRKGEKTESKLPVCLAQVTKDVEALGKLCEVRANLAMELGIAKRTPTQIQTAHLGLYADIVKLPTESRQRVLRAADALLKRLGAGPNGEGAGETAPAPAPPTPLEALKEANKAAAREGMGKPRWAPAEGEQEGPEVDREAG